MACRCPWSASEIFSPSRSRDATSSSSALGRSFFTLGQSSSDDSVVPLDQSDGMARRSSMRISPLRPRAFWTPRSCFAYALKVVRSGSEGSRSRGVFTDTLTVTLPRPRRARTICSISPSWRPRASGRLCLSVRKRWFTERTSTSMSIRRSLCEAPPNPVMLFIWAAGAAASRPATWASGGDSSSSPPSCSAPGRCRPRPGRACSSS